MSDLPGSRMVVSAFPDEEGGDNLEFTSPKRIYDKLDIWDTASKNAKKTLIITWMKQNESFLSIKQVDKLLSQPKDSDPYKNILKILEDFVVLADSKIGSTTNIANTIKKRKFPPDTEINFILNKVARELGYSVI